MELIFNYDNHLDDLPPGLTYQDLVNEFDRISEVNYPLDNIQFYFYTRHRIRAITEKIPAYFNERRSPKETVRLGKNANTDLGDWAYGECDLANNILAVGQPDGSISIIDTNSNTLIKEMSVFEKITDLMWSEVLINSSVICCSGGSTRNDLLNQTKIYNYDGELLREFLPFVRMINTIYIFNTRISGLCESRLPWA